jgi:uncharacterized protein involved in exopolysaccharide biosynthesis
MRRGFRKKFGFYVFDSLEEKTMSWNTVKALGSPSPEVPAVRDFLAMLSRQRRIAVAAFIIVFCGAIIFGLLLSDRYEASMEIMVEQSQLRRAEPVMTGGADAQPIVNESSSNADETLNSEIALLRSDDVLRQVVTTTGLESRNGLWDDALQGVWHMADYFHIEGQMKWLANVLPMFARPTQDERIARAVRTLSAKLRIEVLKMSDVIEIAYRSNNPQLAARVLQALGNVYLKEHALAHYPPGELEFFQKETEQARANMAAAEQKLVQFTQAGGVASGDIQLNDTLQRMSDVQAQRSQTRASISALRHRIADLEVQVQHISPRVTTQLKSSDSALLIQRLKASLLDLQMKRTALLTKYQPNYPLVQEVDKQIAQAREALTDAKSSRVLERTSDRDPNYELVQEDLTRSRAELAGMQAQLATLGKENSSEETQAKTLQKQGVTQQDLMRNAKAAQDNYVLLLHKQEEARVSNELDKWRMFNVSIVQAASVPQLPVHSALWYLIYGGMFGVLFAFASAAGADRLDPTVRTLEDLEAIVGAPVLVALPLSTMALPRVIDDGQCRPARYSGRIFSGL